MNRIFEQIYQDSQYYTFLCVVCKSQKQGNQIWIDELEGISYCIRCKAGKCLQYLPNVLQQIMRVLPNQQIEGFNLQLIKEVKQKCRLLINQITTKLSQFQENLNLICSQIQIRAQNYNIRMKKNQQILERIMKKDNNENIQKTILNYIKNKSFKQQKFLINLDQQSQCLKVFLNKLNNFCFSLPKINQIQQTVQIKSICKTQILSIARYKSKVFMGTAEGEIICKGLFSMFRTKAHQTWIKSLTIYKNKLISGSYDYSIKIWSIFDEHLVLIKVFANNFQKNYYKLNLVVNQKLETLYSATGKIDNYQIQIWSLNSYELIQSIQSQHKDVIKSLFLFNNSDYLVSASVDSTINVWNSIQHQLVAKIYHNCKISMVVPCQKWNLFVVLDEKKYIYIYPLIFHQQRHRPTVTWRIKSANYINMIQQLVAIACVNQLILYTLQGVPIRNFSVSVTMNVFTFVQGRLIGGDGTGKMIQILVQKRKKLI